MAVRQINTADFNYEMMLETINKSYKGKNNITLSEYDSDAATDVKVGSVFDVNGAIFIVESADITPTGYAGIANSTTFYLYWDEDPGSFIYSSTVPTWNDALQGWYGTGAAANDRALFSMFKDSGGTLYQAKNKMQQVSSLISKVIPIGPWNMDATPFVLINHELTDYTRIRSISAMVVNDAGNAILPLFESGGVTSINATQAQITRDNGGTFDSVNFDSTSFNRGWLTITYVE